MSVIALLDIGTNSVKTLVYDAARDAVILSRGVVSGLGEGFVPGGNISEPAIRRNVRIIADEIKKCRELGAKKIIGAGTMILRSAANAADFIDRVFVATGLELRIVSETEEAEWSFLASSALHGKGEVIVFDLGGGSLELNRGKNGKLLDSLSLPLGCAVLSSSYLHGDPPSESEYHALREHILMSLSPAELSPVKSPPVGIGGSLFSITCVALGIAKFSPERINGALLTRKQLQKQLLYYRSHKQNSIARLPGMQAGRESTILAGATVIDALLELTQAESCRVSTLGWRYQLLKLMRG